MVNNINELLDILKVGSIVVVLSLNKSWAFVFRPLAGSPLHFSQNFSSCTFKLAGALPLNDEPGISASESFKLFETELIMCYLPGKSIRRNTQWPDRPRFRVNLLPAFSSKFSLCIACISLLYIVIVGEQLTVISVSTSLGPGTAMIINRCINFC